ncbi:MAG: carbohydrate kinase [Balneolaceae bacterium]
MKHSIVCLGEILWDSMPAGLFPGGAPYNVAYHLKKLGENVKIISRTGNDDLGREAIRRAELNGISAEYIQTDSSLPTGFVEVYLDGKGVPQYNIKKPAAWDEIVLSEDVKKILNEADAVVFGTLAQRSETSRNTIQWIKHADCLKVLDLNLRPPDDSEKVIHSSLEIADLVKLNDDELNVLRNQYQLPEELKSAAETLSEMFKLNAVCITCGGDGAFFLNSGEWTECSGNRITVADTVGAGDAFLAVLVSGYLNNTPPEMLLNLANHLGAWVATQNGSTPHYFVGSVSGIENLSL